MTMTPSIEFDLPSLDAKVPAFAFATSVVAAPPMQSDNGSAEVPVPTVEAFQTVLARPVAENAKLQHALEDIVGQLSRTAFTAAAPSTGAVEVTRQTAASTVPVAEPATVVDRPAVVVPSVDVVSQKEIPLVDVAARRVEQPVVEQPVVERPVVEQPAVVVSPVDVVSQKEIPLVDMASRRVEQPVVERPVVEQPAVVASPVDVVPQKEIPLVDVAARRVEQPVVERPVVDQPAVVVPPVDVVPQKEVPLVDVAARRVEQPVVERPVVEQPVVVVPPVDVVPQKEVPLVDVASRRVDQPAVEQPVVEQPVVEQPAVVASPVDVVPQKEIPLVDVAPRRVEGRAVLDETDLGEAIVAAGIRPVVDGMMPVAPQVVAAESGAVTAVDSVRAAFAPMEVLPAETFFEVANAVADVLLVSPGLLRGEGEMRVQLRPDVLEGSEIRIAVTGRQLAVEFFPQTSDVAVLIEQNRPQLEQHLAARFQTFALSVGVRRRHADEMRGSVG